MWGMCLHYLNENRLTNRFSHVATPYLGSRASRRGFMLLIAEEFSNGNMANLKTYTTKIQDLVEPGQAGFDNSQKGKVHLGNMVMIVFCSNVGAGMIQESCKEYKPIPGSKDRRRLEMRAFKTTRERRLFHKKIAGEYHDLWIKLWNGIKMTKSGHVDKRSKSGAREDGFTRRLHSSNKMTDSSTPEPRELVTFLRSSVEIRMFMMHYVNTKLDYELLHEEHTWLYGAYLSIKEDYLVKMNPLS